MSVSFSVLPDLGQPTGQQGSARVHSETEPVGDPGGDRHDVLQRARHLHPDEKDAYSWWSYFAKARERNVGWRIDYFLVSSVWKDHIKGASIHSDILGSDHCPVELDLEC